MLFYALLITQICKKRLSRFIKIFQNTPQLCWGDEWPTLSPGRQPGRASGPEGGRGLAPWSNTKYSTG